MTSFDQFLVDASIRTTVVLSGTACLALVLRVCYSSAAVRHWVWTVGLVGALAVPVLMAIAPAVPVSVPWLGAKLSPEVIKIAAPENNADEALLAWVLPVEIASENVALTQAGGLEATAQPANPTIALPQVSWLVLAWSVGAILGLVPICLGMASLWSLSGRSIAVSSGPLFDALRQAMKQLGLAMPVRLLVSAERTMPMTWGVWRPTVLLPVAAAGWPSERLNMVLLHELAHVARRDCLALIVGQVARAVYWFNPLVWLAERCLRVEQERACDDFVLSRGASAPDYAEQLLSVAASCLPARGAAVGLAMAGGSRLEQRLVAILNPRLNRRPLARQATRAIGALTVALTALISAVQLTPTAVLAQAPAQKAAEKSGTAIEATDRAKSLADLRSKIVEQYAKPVNENEIMQGAIKGMVQSLGDPYSEFMSTESLAQMERQIAGNITGIGAQLEMHEQQLRVVTPLPGSPALKAGVQPGDMLLEIDGQSTTRINLADAVKRIVGPAGSNVRLVIGRNAGQRVELSVTRGPITLPTIRAFQSAASGEPNYLLDETQKIGYIQVDQFGAAAPQEMKAAIESLKGAGLKGLILDLRNCPGGLLDSAVGVAKLFLSGGTIVTIQRRGSETTTIKADESQRSDFPVVVMVSGQTASAAEVLVGALQDNRRALVLGTRTLGKGSVQTLIKLDDGSGAIRLTTSEYRLPSGRSIDKRPGEKAWGIDPDDGYFVPLDRSKASAMQDRRQARHVVGGKAVAPRRGAVTPESLETQEHDPQLAAALRTLTARLQSGSYTKVSTLTAAQIEQFLKRDEIEQRREVAAKNLETIDQELAALGNK